MPIWSVRVYTAWKLELLINYTKHRFLSIRNFLFLRNYQKKLNITVAANLKLGYFFLIFCVVCVHLTDRYSSCQKKKMV